MSGLKDKFKGGWHPKGKDGKSKESWRGDFKGVDQVAGWMGKKKSATEEANEHVSRPLHSLKDPSAFGPPPKHINYHGGAALPNQITPDRSGLGAPLSRAEIEANEQAEEEAQREAEEAAKPKGPPIPYRADRTGLSTSNLPPPPGHKDRRPVEPADKPKPPGLPPRLPPRQNSNPGPSAPSPPPTYGATIAEPDAHRGVLNQGALSRLGAAGVSVPGFGIGGGAAKSKAPLPPPGMSSPARTPAPAASSASSAQLGELQSRFSRLSASSSPKPDAPSEGTTFAQKQAALKTASSFRNDPSSVSLSDARVAASTANNFRERHGEQVKSGWQSANKLNTKYGIADKVGAYGGTPTHEPEVSSPQIDMRDNSTPPPAVAVLGKKKPPPPPPMKKAALSGAGLSQASQPPPIPMSSKPKPQSSSSKSNSALPKDIDLDLQSLWFTRSPVQFSPKIVAQIGKVSQASTSGWSSSGPRKTHTFATHIRFNDTLASTKIKITWDASNPAVTVKAEQKHFPPPRELSKRDLDGYRDTYNEDLANWCESKMGTQVGNGECWTLANDGLKAIAAQNTSLGREPCMSSQSYVHGSLIYSFVPSISSQPSPPGGIPAAGVARGDIIQFLSAHFKTGNGGEAWAGMPDHTSVITEVRRDGVLGVVEQNSGGVKKVKRGEYDMRGLVGGEVRIFRPVGNSWVGDLDPSW